MDKKWVARVVLPHALRHDAKLAAAQANISLQDLIERALVREIAEIAIRMRKKAKA